MKQYNFFFFARDPGGANVITPIVKKMNERNNVVVHVYGKEFALKSFRSEGIPVEDITEYIASDKLENYVDFLTKEEIDVVITGTSLNDYTERYLWKASNKLKIPSYAIQDQWIHLGIRFSSYTYETADEYYKKPTHPFLPHRVLVMDEVAKNIMISEGVDRKKVAITGQPHFDIVRDRFSKAKRSSQSDMYRIVFASEPKFVDGEYSFWGYSERTIFDYIYQAIEYLSSKNERKINLIIRPHPRDDTSYWLAKKELSSGKIKISVNTESNSIDLIRNADLICGMSSMFLIEAALCGVPFLSCLIGLKEDSPFIFDRLGLYRSSRSYEELISEMERLLLYDEKVDLKIDFIKNATEKTVEYIMEDWSNACVSD